VGGFTRSMVGAILGPCQNIQHTILKSLEKIRFLQIIISKWEREQYLAKMIDCPYQIFLHIQ
jgi:hypothetical protein